MLVVYLALPIAYSSFSVLLMPKDQRMTPKSLNEAIPTSDWSTFTSLQEERSLPTLHFVSFLFFSRQFC